LNTVLEIFKGSELETDVPHITKIFDRETKLLFSNANDALFMKFGRMRDHFPALNVKGGRLRLEG
jgi:hypothetical protein